MLVLSRKLDQAIVIQGNIAIKILDITGDRVKIGITAPRHVVVLREELADETAAAAPDLLPSLAPTPIAASRPILRRVVGA